MTEMAELLLPGSFSSGTLYLARLTGSVWLAGMFSTKDVNSRKTHSRVESRNSRVSIETVDFARVVDQILLHMLCAKRCIDA